MIREYCRVGINHHLIFPGVLQDPWQHEKTLFALLEADAFDVIDLSLPDEGAVRERETRMLREARKTYLYNFPLFCLGSDGLDTNAHDAATRLRTLDEAKKHLDYAAGIGCGTVTFASGPLRAGIPYGQQLEGFLEYSLLFDQQLKERGMVALLEPFDRSIGKNLLLGPSRDCVEYIEKLRERGAQNIALMQDMGHLPLIGESFLEALETCRPYLQHIHVGNCVMRDPSSPYYGDQHPPLGIDGGENDLPELTDFIAALRQTGYLYPGGSHTVSIEMQPYPGARPLTSARLGLEKLETAFRAVFS